MTRWFTRMASTLPPTSRMSSLGDDQRLVVPIVQRDGTALLGMSPLEFMQRLAALSAFQSVVGTVDKSWSMSAFGESVRRTGIPLCRRKRLWARC